MKIIIPALPSDYAKPYPELVFEIPAQDIHLIVAFAEARHIYSKSLGG